MGRVASRGAGTLRKIMDSHKAYAVVACDRNGHGAVLWHLGLTGAIEEPGLHELGDIGLDDANQGISIWNGHLVWTCSPSTPNRPEEWDFELEGPYRDPTDEEWEAIRRGNNLFEPLRCQHAEESGYTTDTPCGPESETIWEQCESVAEHEGLCEKHHALIRGNDGSHQAPT